MAVIFLKVMGHGLIYNLEGGVGIKLSGKRDFRMSGKKSLDQRCQIFLVLFVKRLPIVDSI